jgi:hypothetical protein
MEVECSPEPFAGCWIGQGLALDVGRLPAAEVMLKKIAS